MNNAIELSHVTKTYPTFTLQDLSLTLPTGCIMGLVGENGAGKSTTLRLIMNTITRDSGEITVLGQDNRSDAFRELKYLNAGFQHLIAGVGSAVWNSNTIAEER